MVSCQYVALGWKSGTESRGDSFTDVFLKIDIENTTPAMSPDALRTYPPKSGSSSFLSLGASKDEGLALALAAVNGATV